MVLGAYRYPEEGIVRSDIDIYIWKAVSTGMYSSMGTCIYVSRPGEEGALLGSISDIYFYKFTYHGASWQRFASWRADLVIWEISPVGGDEVDQLAPVR